MKKYILISAVLLVGHILYKRYKFNKEVAFFENNKKQPSYFPERTATWKGGYVGNTSLTYEQCKAKGGNLGSGGIGGGAMCVNPITGEFYK
jgi:hypothetical protein